MQLRTQLKCFSFPYTSLKWDSDPNYFHIDGVAHNHQTTKIKGEDPVHSAPTMLSLAPVAKKSAAGSLGRYYIMSPGFLGLWILIFLVDCFVNRMFSTCTNSNCPETPSGFGIGVHPHIKDNQQLFLSESRHVWFLHCQIGGWWF